MRSYKWCNERQIDLGISAVTFRTKKDILSETPEFIQHLNLNRFESLIRSNLEFLLRYR